MTLTRRSFAKGGVSVVLFFFGFMFSGALPYAGAQDAMKKTLAFRWRVPTVHSETVEDALVFSGTIEEERNTKGLPLVLVFVGVAMLPSLVDALLTLRRKLTEPGLKIDARGKQIMIDVDSALPRGMILIIDGSGAKLYQPDQLTAPAELGQALAGAK